MQMPISPKPAIQRPLEFIFLSALCLLLLDWLKISLQQLKRRKKTHFHSSGRKRRCQTYPASPVSCLCQRKNAWTSMTNYKPLKKRKKTRNFLLAGFNWQKISPYLPVHFLCIQHPLLGLLPLLPWEPPRWHGWTPQVVCIHMNCGKYAFRDMFEGSAVTNHIIYLIFVVNNINNKPYLILL